jgi:hypothetical protein
MFGLPPEVQEEVDRARSAAEKRMTEDAAARAAFDAEWSAVGKLPKDAPISPADAFASKLEAVRTADPLSELTDEQRDALWDSL